MTEIGEIPDNWEVSRLGSEKVSLYVKSGSTPRKRDQGNWNGDIPFVTQSDMTNVDHYLRETSEKITESGLKSSNLVLVPKNSILLSMYGTIGKVVINKIPVTVSQNVAAIKLNIKNVNKEYLYYVIQQYSSQFKRQAKTITLSHLDNKIVKNAIVPFPSLPEQQKIAEVLSTADETIQKANEEITLTEKHKKGLMQTLLTKGIGHTKFKMTEIEEIPEEWGTSELRKVFKIITGTTPSTKIKKYWIGGTFEWLTPKDLSQMNDNLIISPSERKVTTNALNESNLNILPEGSILISTRAPVGYVGINRVQITFNQGCKGLVPLVCEGYSSFFYAYYLKYKKEFLNSVSSGSTFKELSKERLERLVVPIPPWLEQQKIAEILTAVDNKLELLGNKKAKLEKLKKGLMGDLLTGKIRVKLNTSKGED